MRTHSSTIAHCPVWDAKDSFGRAISVSKNRKPGQPYGYYRHNGLPITSPNILVTWTEAKRA